MEKDKILFLSVVVLSSFIAFSQAAHSQEAEQWALRKDVEDWFVVESAYTTICVDKSVDMAKLVTKINVNFARYDPVEKSLFLDRGISDSQQLANKVDIIVRKAKKILDMHPKDFHVDIKVYHDEEKIWDVYEEIFAEKKRHTAFYIHKFRTIYISLEKISEAILAHEIGHSIIDSYFTVLPPEKIRELLACYVDVHLED